MQDEEIEIAGRRIGIERGPAIGQLRILIDGAPLPMTYEHLRDWTGSSGRSTVTVLRPAAPAEWIDTGMRLPHPFRFGPDKFHDRGLHDGRYRVSVTLEHHLAEGLGTVVSDSRWLYLSFPADLAAVDVRVTEYVDTSA
ncbi:hypothetical protein [Nocardia inohanensis]|uniref:hypothetical protein n=1 Tax=Nocardia inohanensis TaxID=209246 RepID=UPI000A4719C0|nr:hypothetical protein [Nocardia inohanensis]